MKRDEAITARHAQVEPRLASGETQDEEEECCGLPPGQTKKRDEVNTAPAKKVCVPRI